MDKGDWFMVTSFILIAVVVGYGIGQYSNDSLIKVYEGCPTNNPYNQDLPKEVEIPLVCNKINDCYLNQTAIGCHKPDPCNTCCISRGQTQSCTLIGCINYKTKSICDNSTGRMECKWVE